MSCMRGAWLHTPERERREERGERENERRGLNGSGRGNRSIVELNIPSFARICIRTFSTIERIIMA